MADPAAARRAAMRCCRHPMARSPPRRDDMLAGGAARAPRDGARLHIEPKLGCSLPGDDRIGPPQLVSRRHSHTCCHAFLCSMPTASVGRVGGSRRVLYQRSGISIGLRVTPSALSFVCVTHTAHEGRVPRDHRCVCRMGCCVERVRISLAAYAKLSEALRWRRHDGQRESGVLLPR